MTISFNSYISYEEILPTFVIRLEVRKGEGRKVVGVDYPMNLGVGSFSIRLDSSVFSLNKLSLMTNRKFKTAIHTQIIYVHPNNHHSIDLITTYSSIYDQRTELDSELQRE